MRQNKITIGVYIGRKLKIPIPPLTQSFSALFTPCQKKSSTH